MPSAKDLLTIPNLLSISRLIFLPFLFLLAWQGNSKNFLILFILVGLTDALDGYMARLMGTESPLGAWLDSLADQFFYPSIAIWVWFFTPEIILENLRLISIIVAFFLLNHLICFVRHKKMSTLHLYSSKLFALALYGFMVWTLLMPASHVIFYVVVGIGIASTVEEFVVLSSRDYIDENIRTVFDRDQ